MNAKKLASLEKEKIQGLEKNIKANNEQTGTNVQRLDTLENSSEQQINGLENNLKSINESMGTNA